MGRKNLGGDSYLRANRSSKGYNETLEHVYQTSLANLDDKHTKRASRRRLRVPNFLSLCLKSAADDVIDTDISVPESVQMSSNRDDKKDATTKDAFVDNDAVFLMKDGKVGHGSHYRAQRGMSIYQAMQSMMGRNVDGKPDAYTA